MGTYSLSQLFDSAGVVRKYSYSPYANKWAWPCSNVLVPLGCYKKIPCTGWLINNRNSFLIVLEPGESKIKVPSDSVPGEDLLPGSWMTSSHYKEGAKDLSGVPFIGMLIPFTRPNRLPKAPLPNTIAWGIRFQYINFVGGIKTFTIGL